MRDAPSCYNLSNEQFDNALNWESRIKRPDTYAKFS